MKKLVTLIVSMVMFFSSTAMAQYHENLDSRITGKISRYSTTNIDVNKDFYVRVSFNSDNKSKKIKYGLDFCFEPTNEKLNPFPVYLNTSPLIGYSTQGTTTDYRQTLFTGTYPASQSRGHMDGWVVGKDNVIRPHFTDSTGYVPAFIGLTYDSYYADPTSRVDKQMKKTNEYWETQSQFTKRLLDNIKSGNGMTFYLLYFKSELDAVKLVNGHQLQITVGPEVLQEWKKVLVGDGYLQ